MQAELMKCQDILTEFGGHAMAAGFLFQKRTWTNSVRL